MELFRIHKTIPFMKYSKILNAISFISFFIAIGLLVVRGLAFSIEFTGGLVMEVNYPDAVVEKDLLVKLHPALPEHIVVKMVDFANEIRKQFIGASDSYTDTIEVTLSTRTLLRWADLTLRFQPLAHQGIQPLSYALDRALGFRASRPTRAMLHELLQRMFPMDCHLGE